MSWQSCRMRGFKGFKAALCSFDMKYEALCGSFFQQLGWWFQDCKLSWSAAKTKGERHKKRKQIMCRFLTLTEPFTFCIMHRSVNMFLQLYVCFKALNTGLLKLETCGSKLSQISSSAIFVTSSLGFTASVVKGGKNTFFILSHKKRFVCARLLYANTKAGKSHSAVFFLRNDQRKRAGFFHPRSLLVAAKSDSWGTDLCCCGVESSKVIAESTNSIKDWSHWGRLSQSCPLPSSFSNTTDYICAAKMSISAKSPLKHSLILLQRGEYTQ